MSDKDYLKLAIEQARKSVEAGGFAAGAIVVKDGKVIAEGISLGRKLNDPTEHAETSAIRTACKTLGSYLDGATLYGSLECCNMCFSVANWAGISKIVYACRKTPEMIRKLYYEGSASNESINDCNNRKIAIQFIPDFEEEVLKKVGEWELKNR